MEENEIKKQSMLLSQLIVESEEYENLIKAQEGVKEDLDAFRLMIAYQTLGKEASQKTAQGLTLSKEEMRVLSEQEAKINNNKAIQYWGECQTIFSKMLADVLEIIQQGLSNGNSNDASNADNSKLFNIYPQ